jgi:ribonuclease P protein component
MQQTFTKSERLCSKKVLGELFKKGSAAVRTFYLFPFRVLYIPHTEAYRLNKSAFHSDSSHPAYIAFLYTAKQIISFEEIEKGMKLALKKM